jgi:DNA-binding NtrC family response regulator
MPEHLPEYILGQNKNDNIDDMITVKKIGPLKELLMETEIHAVKKALEICGGNRKKAMEMLGVGKTNFYKKLKKAMSS